MYLSKKVALLFLGLSFISGYKAVGEDKVIGKSYKEIVDNSDCIDHLIKHIPISDSLDIHFKADSLKVKDDPFVIMLNIGTRIVNKDSLYLRIQYYYKNKDHKELNEKRAEVVLNNLKGIGGLNKKIKYIEICSKKISCKHPNYPEIIDEITFKLVGFVSKDQNEEKNSIHSIPQK